MKMKLVMMSAVLLLITAGCQQNDTSKANKPATTTSIVEIKLTPEEVTNTRGNANIGAQMLVRKAVIKEMETYKYTPEEQAELDTAIENLKAEFFLNRTASKSVDVTDEEVLTVYKQNADKLKDADIEVVFPQIKQEIFLLKVNTAKAAFMNSLVDKYQLNDRIKEYYPLEEVKVEEAATTETPNSEEAPNTEATATSEE